MRQLYALHLSPDRSRVLGNILHVSANSMVYEDLQTKTEHNYINLVELIKNHLGVDHKDLFYLIDIPDSTKKSELNTKGRLIMELTVNPIGNDDPIKFNVYTKDEETFTVESEEEFFEVAGLTHIEEVFGNIADYLMEEEVELLWVFKEEPVEPKWRVKELSEVEIGDLAYPVGSGDPLPTEDVVGEVVWVGDFRALLREEKYRDLYLTWEVSPAQMLAEYNELVVLRVKDGFNSSSYTLFNYNCDSSGVRCFTNK